MTSASLAWTPRFAGRPRTTGFVLVVFVLLMLWGILTGSSIPDSARSDDPDRTDSALYGAIVDRMDDGLGYYEAVSVEQPSRGYPTSPVMTVREPTLAWFTSTVGDRAMTAILWALAAAAIVGSIRVFEKTERTRASWVATVLLAALALSLLALPSALNVHEVWLGLLLYLGLLCRGRGWIAASIVLLLVASLVRELVAPVMVVMMAHSWLQGRRKEPVAWAGAILVFWTFYAVHIIRVHELVADSEAHARGWVSFGGWPFVVDAVRASSVLSALPFWVAAVTVPLALVGWVSRRGSIFDPVSVFLVSYAVLFCVVGRPDNGYWGALLAPFLLPGTALGVGFVIATVTELKHGPIATDP